MMEPQKKRFVTLNRKRKTHGNERVLLPEKCFLNSGDVGCSEFEMIEMMMIMKG
jgi:hypothetical protein